MAGFRRAVAEGFSYLELDVRATADGIAVVHHDATLDRTTDATGAIAELSLAELSSARVGGREPVPVLEQLLVELPDARLTIELKDDAVVDPVLKLLASTDSWHRVCIGSYSEARLDRVRDAGRAHVLTSMARRSTIGLRTQAWLSPMSIGPMPAVRGQLAQLPRYYGPIRVIDKSLLRTARRLGVEVHVWTVDTAEEMTELLDLGVAGLLSDQPDVLRAVLRERGQWPTSSPAR